MLGGRLAPGTPGAVALARPILRRSGGDDGISGTRALKRLWRFTLCWWLATRDAIHFTAAGGKDAPPSAISAAYS